MATVAILNDVHDAEWVRVSSNSYHGTILIATHAAVNDYLASYGIACESISSYIEQEELVKLYSDSTPVEDLLTELDANLGQILNSAAGTAVSLRFFDAMYRYLGRYEHFNYLKLQTALNRIVNRHSPKSLVVFAPHFSESTPSFFKSKIDVLELIIKSLGISVEKQTSPLSKKILRRQRLDKYLTLFKGGVWLAKKAPAKIWPKLFGMLRRQPSLLAVELSGTAGWIILFDGVRSLSLMPKDRTVRRVCALNDETIKYGEALHKPSLQADALQRLKEHAQKEFDRLANLEHFSPVATTRAVIVGDLAARFESCIFPLLKMQQLAKDNRICGGVWSYPPTDPSAKSLMVHYLLCSGLPVIGRQHGGNYGIEKNYPRHFDSDFRSCTHYLTYGFNASDLKETMAEAVAQCQIIPVGLPHIARSGKRQRRYNILFPISNATYFFRDTVRPLQHHLSHIQCDLLQFLDRLLNVRVLVKPFMLYDSMTCAFTELIRHLPNIEVVSHMSLTDCLQDFEIDAMVVEYISSPLFEGLPQDIEILSLSNPLLPFNHSAEILLKKRAHIFDDLDCLKNGIEDFLGGRLPKKQDRGFVDRYLHQNQNSVGDITGEILGLNHAELSDEKLARVE
jgi:hypothetical protein